MGSSTASGGGSLFAMMPAIVVPARRKVLIADDEPDIHAITRLSLRDLVHGEEPVEFISAKSGRETVERLREQPDIGVVLLDVVMEDEHAGLEAIGAIREQLGNRLVRILLRTGQPGAAPERETIERYDIDGYLPKGEEQSPACSSRCGRRCGPGISLSSSIVTAASWKSSTNARCRCTPSTRSRTCSEKSSVPRSPSARRRWPSYAWRRCRAARSPGLNQPRVDRVRPVGGGSND